MLGLNAVTLWGTQQFSGRTAQCGISFLLLFQLSTIKLLSRGEEQTPENSDVCVAALNDLLFPKRLTFLRGQNSLRQNALVYACCFEGRYCFGHKVQFLSVRDCYVCARSLQKTRWLVPVEKSHFLMQVFFP